MEHLVKFIEFWDFLSQKQGASPFPKALLSFLSPSVIHVADFLFHANENLSQAFLGGTKWLLGTSIKIPGIQIQQHLGKTRELARTYQ